MLRSLTAEPSTGSLEWRESLARDRVVAPVLDRIAQELETPYIFIPSGLSELEDKTSVHIRDFVTSEDYLGYRDPYPRLMWALELFYSPQDYSSYFRETFGLSDSEIDELYFNQLVLFMGFKSGKTTTAGILCLYELYKLLCLESPQSTYNQSRDQELFVTNVATSGQQAQDTIWAHVKGLREGSRWFTEYESRLSRLSDRKGPLFRDNETQLTYRHKNVIARTEHSKSASKLGKTAKCVAIDEIAKFDMTAGPRSGRRSLNAAKNNLSPLKLDGVLAAISSPEHVNDLICELFGCCGFQIESAEIASLYKTTERIVSLPKDPHSLGLHFATWEVNPHRTKDTLVYDFEINPEDTWRDYGSVPSYARDSFFRNPQRLIELFGSASRPNPINESGQFESWFRERPEIDYFMHCDAGLVGKKEGDRYSGSFFGLALGHGDVGTMSDDQGNTESVILPTFDLVARIGSNPELGEIDYENDVYPFLLDVFDRFPSIRVLTFDRWQDVWLMQVARRYVKKLERYVVGKTDYDELKRSLYQGTVVLYRDQEDLLEELIHLELVNGSRVEKGLGFVKDMSDCAASIVSRVLKSTDRPRVAGRATGGYFSGGTVGRVSTYGESHKVPVPYGPVLQSRTYEAPARRRTFPRRFA